MTDDIFYQLFYGILLYFGLLVIVAIMNGGFAFNLKANYKRWYELNWFGVWFFTILYWIVFLPFTLIYVLYWLFTVGRSD